MKKMFLIVCIISQTLYAMDDERLRNRYYHAQDLQHLPRANQNNVRDRDVQSFCKKICCGFCFGILAGTTTALYIKATDPAFVAALNKNFLASFGFGDSIRR